jgi:lipoprotein-releasing system ATP-binding protein
MSDVVLTLEGVEKYYNKGLDNEICVLSGAQLALAPGELVALVAPSGAGKSTLLHIAGLLDEADNGSVEIDGQTLSGKSDRRRTRARREDIGFVYQFHHLLPEFSALENIALPQMANGVSKADAEVRGRELLETVGVAHRANTARRSCLGASSNGWRFAELWPISPGFCWQMNRQAILIQPQVIRCLRRW